MEKLKIFWIKFRTLIVSKVVNLFAKQLNYDLDKTILILGSTRSGTTFLMESLNRNNDYRLIFEPFNPSYSREWEAFSARQYLNPNKVSDQELRKVGHILSGKITNSWVDRYNRKLRSSARIIKAVRANLLLDLIEQKFPQVRIIYIYRNPYDVVASRIGLNFDPLDFQLILEHDAFMKKYYPNIDAEKLVEKLNDNVHRHTAMWCLENRFILQTMNQRNLINIHFEDVKGKTVELSETGLRVSDKKSRPSLTSSLHATYKLSPAEIEGVSSVLRYFNMGNYIELK